jgi:tol-pal system-associated acyl-CoA thioesterase
MKTFLYPTDVFIEDTDYGGVVFHPNYIKYMQRARTVMLRQRLGLQWQDIEKQGYFVVSDISIQFKRSARLNNQLMVSVDVEQLRQASVVFKQVVYDRQQTDCIYATALVKVAFVNLAGKPTALPDVIRKMLN